ncbi:hypothetical protein [Anaerobacillus alkalidiazotrophicus]|nr:hypothetical protein [Anaerobacillus alkalidiazotrophicus]
MDGYKFRWYIKCDGGDFGENISVEGLTTFDADFILDILMF